MNYSYRLYEFPYFFTLRWNEVFGKSLLRHSISITFWEKKFLVFRRRYYVYARLYSLIIKLQKLWARYSFIVILFNKLKMEIGKYLLSDIFLSLTVYNKIIFIIIKKKNTKRSKVIFNETEIFLYTCSFIIETITNESFRFFLTPN